MKRFVLAGLSTLALSIATSPAVQAETTPDELVNLAEQGYLQEQGIPSYNSLNHAIRFGQLNAEDLVEAAIAENRLAPEMLNDADYLSSVEFKLNNLRWY